MGAPQLREIPVGLRLFLLQAAAATALLATAGARADGCADVEVRNVRAQQGHLMLTAYADADTFSKKPLTSLRLPAGEATMRFQVCGLSGSAVALILFQDLDSDGKLARNLVGIPTEPWGSSGAPGRFGPKWETAKVTPDGKPIVVLMSQ